MNSRHDQFADDVDCILQERTASVPWTVEQLDELHSELYAFLSFMDATTLEVAGKRDLKIVGHVRALKRGLEMKLNDHGGRFYNPKQQTVASK